MPLDLNGILGVVVELTKEKTLADLPIEQQRKLETFLLHAMPGDTLEFKAGELDAKARFAVHRFCMEKKLKSTSKGPKKARQMIVSKPGADGDITKVTSKPFVESPYMVLDPVMWAALLDSTIDFIVPRKIDHGAEKTEDMS